MSGETLTLYDICNSSKVFKMLPSPPSRDWIVHMWTFTTSPLSCTIKHPSSNRHAHVLLLFRMQPAAIPVSLLYGSDDTR